ncbi:alpha/beta fold hydrolase [Ilumatobacter nonamiensis]|uniref:alpha/beta fold hydrolase n=1 Tax=Ilumatobacter nonamiensis TaxID=467093 RepID=UPI00034A62AE|nr:alpha/beta hydrolase [Ilumatobacter nonamiensis]
MDVDDRAEYDEFSLFHENVAEFDLGLTDLPEVVRVETALDGDAQRRVSALRWGTGPVEVVFVHGGAQNAHTWDTVALALGRNALAIDLPGHGHSGWRDDGAYTPINLADDIAVAIEAQAPTAQLVVGMSLGGLTSMELAVRHPELVRHLVLVDITPGVNQQKAKAVIDFVDGPQEFASFDALLERTMEFNPTRSESSLRRGILHNARQESDGSWQWRYDRSSHVRSRDLEESDLAGSPMWDDFGAVASPMTLVRGSLSPVVDDDDVAEARRRQPELTVHVVDGAGHSVQGDRPIELAALLAERLT